MDFTAADEQAATKIQVCDIELHTSVTVACLTIGGSLSTRHCTDFSMNKSHNTGRIPSTFAKEEVYCNERRNQGAVDGRNKDTGEFSVSS
jgi:hypothetical protein